MYCTWNNFYWKPFGSSSLFSMVENSAIKFLPGGTFLQVESSSIMNMNIFKVFITYWQLVLLERWISFHYPHICPHIFISTWLRRQRKASRLYRWPLNNTGVNCVGSLIHRVFSINTVSVFPLPNNPNNISFPITYLTVKIQYIIPTTYKLFIDCFCYW